jgi:hypothetical protein
LSLTLHPIERLILGLSPTQSSNQTSLSLRLRLSPSLSWSRNQSLTLVLPEQVRL